MGMTLLLHTLEGREYSDQSADHSLMLRFADALDRLCEDAGVKPLSEFFDHTDAQYSFDADEFGDFADGFDLDEAGGAGFGDDEDGYGRAGIAADAGGDDAEDADDEALDAETGLAYGIDDMVWFDAAEGLATLRALVQMVQQEDAMPDLNSAQTRALLEELQDCVQCLEDTEQRGGRFHLALVE